jgi:hypothetical protein
LVEKEEKIKTRILYLSLSLIFALLMSLSSPEITFGQSTPSKGTPAATFVYKEVWELTVTKVALEDHVVYKGRNFYVEPGYSNLVIFLRPKFIGQKSEWFAPMYIPFEILDGATGKRVEYGKTGFSKEFNPYTESPGMYVEPGKAGDPPTIDQMVWHVSVPKSKQDLILSLSNHKVGLRSLLSSGK